MKQKRTQKTVAIIGVGLIGGSLGMALRRSRPARYRVIGIGRHTARLARAQSRGAVDEYTTDLSAGLARADIVVICTPVSTIAPLVKEMAPFLKPGTVITDAGSVKGPVVSAVRRMVNSPSVKARGCCFIGGHPMAGSEKAGIEFAEPGLFDGAVVAVTPDKSAPAAGLRAVREMWERTHARVLVMKPAEHDRMVAVVSHLPHLIAYGLCAIAEKASRRQSALPALIAGSFRDLTRIAASNPQDWAGICSANGPEVARAVDRMIFALEHMKKQLHSPRSLERVFTAAQKARRGLLNN